ACQGPVSHVHWLTHTTPFAKRRPPPYGKWSEPPYTSLSYLAPGATASGCRPHPSPNYLLKSIAAREPRPAGQGRHARRGGAGGRPRPLLTGRDPARTLFCYSVCKTEATSVQ